VGGGAGPLPSVGMSDIWTKVEVISTAVGALATLGLAGLAVPNLRMLRRYVEDTNRLAVISNDQLESSQKQLELSREQLEGSQAPFVVLTIEESPNPLFMVVYRLENQGSGPAINISGQIWYEDGERKVYQRASVEKGGSIELEASQRVINARFEYESLSGRKYITNMDGGTTTFIKSPA
jgi:hypothetical protein